MGTDVLAELPKKFPPLGPAPVAPTGALNDTVRVNRRAFSRSSSICALLPSPMEGPVPSKGVPIAVADQGAL